MLLLIFFSFMGCQKASHASELELQKRDSRNSERNKSTYSSTPKIKNHLMIDTKHYESNHKIPVEELVKKSPDKLHHLSNETIKQYTLEELKDIYEYGWGNRYKKNFQQAVALYRIASLGGNCEAQIQYAEMLYQGIGVKENKKEAFYWAYKAAENGDIGMASSLFQYVQDKELAKRFNFSQVEEEEKKVQIIRLNSSIRKKLKNIQK